MNQSLVRNSLFGAAIGAVIGFFAGKVSSHRPAPSDDGFGVIFLFGTGSERVAKVLPDPIKARKNGKIDWLVAEFQPASGNGDLTIKWLKHDPTTGVSHDKPNKKLKGKVRGNAVPGRYGYEIKEDGVLLADPDVEIVQF